MDFPVEIMDAVYKLRNKYKQKKHCVISAFPILEIVAIGKSNIGRDQETSTKFFYDYITGTFEMQAPTYKYCSKISYYDFNKTERRWTRNKGYIFTLIRDLKFCGLWKHISNKDIIIINTFNDKADMEERASILKEILKE